MTDLLPPRLDLGTERLLVLSTYDKHPYTREQIYGGKHL